MSARKRVGTIDLTPTWSAILPVMLAVLDNPDAPHESKDTIRTELARMAGAADAYNVAVKEGRIA